VGEHGRVEGQQLRLLAAGPLPPLLEVGAADDLGADPGVVEVEQRVLVDHDVAPPSPVLELLGLLQQPQVLLVEPVRPSRCQR
jgi:hypothetical protein